MLVAVEVVALVLVTAGVAKLGDPDPARRLLDRLGVAVPAVAIRGLGAIELLVGAAGVVAGGRLAALALAVLHVGFAGVALAAARAGDVPCGCFGARGRAAPGWIHVGGALVSAAVCGVATVAPPGGIADAFDSGVGGGLAHVAAVAVVAALVVAAYTDGADALAGRRDRRTASAALGADLVGVTPSGEPLALAVGAEPGVTLLAFLSSRCLTCEAFWTAFGSRDGRRLGGVDVHVVVITRGPDVEPPSAIAALAPAGVATVMSDRAFDAFAVSVSPSFVLVEGPGARVLARAVLGSWGDLEDLVAAADRGRRR